MVLAALLPSAGAIGPGTSYSHDLAASHEPAGMEGHIDALADDLHTLAQATYLYLEAPLQWRVEQSFEQGAPCVGDTSQHQQLEPMIPDGDLLWDKHVRRRFNFADLNRIVVKPGAKPDLYSIPAEFVSGSPEAYTVTISTQDDGFDIEYYGFDGGRIVAKEAPLSFSSYYHNLFVITRSKATDVAAHLRALAEECGAESVQVYDLAR